MFSAGIDAHLTYLVVAVVSKDGELLVRPTRVSVRQPQRLRALLAPYRPLEAVVETCPAWPWLYELLTGWEVTLVLAHAKRLRAIAESDYKNDRLDTVLLARMQVAGLIPRVFAKPREQREQAALVRHRVVLVRQRTALLNRIHAHLHVVGLHIARGKLKTKAARPWLRQVAWPQLSGEPRRLIRSQLTLIDAIGPLVAGVDRRVRQVADALPVVAQLRTVPGIGAYRGLLIAVEVLPIGRFAHAKQLVSYAGLAPRSRQSGERAVRYASIPFSANRWLRGVLVRTVVSHVKCAPHSWLSRYYAEQKTRLGWQAARKLCRALHAMLRTGEGWKNETHVSMPRGELHFTHVATTT